MPAPVLLALVLAAVVVVALLVRRRPAKPAYRGSTRRAKRVAVVLMAGSVVLLAIGFTQFRLLRERSAAGAVVLAIDASESMSRADIEPSRLEAAVGAARAFLEELPSGIRVGLVAFSGQAQVLVPPSAEHGRVLDALAELPRGDGTVIGDAIAEALDAIEGRRVEERASPAAIVLLSDGRDTGSSVTPEEAAARATGLEIPVHTVVLGRDLSGERAGANIELMERIAQQTGGSAFTATTAGGLLDVYEELRTRLSTELAITDFGALFVVASAVLAVAAAIAILVALRSRY